MSKSIFPPRPKGKINPSDLPRYEKSNLWLAQRKFNGSRSPINISPEGDVTTCSRHGEAHKRFSITKSIKDKILSSLHIQKGVEYWIDAEVMNKTKGSNDTLVLYDILQVGSYFYLKPNQVERLKILRDICGNPSRHDSEELALQICPGLWLADVFYKNFVSRFKESEKTDKIEGLVLRRKDSVLDHFGNAEYECSWMIRCRKPHKNYNF